MTSSTVCRCFGSPLPSARIPSSRIRPESLEASIGAVIGDILPLALGIAISPVPIIAGILMLLSARAGATSGFLAGWILGIIIATSVFTAIAGSLTTGGE
jgi:hypothetical protein